MALTHPGVGALTAAFVLIRGQSERFLAVTRFPEEESSGEHQRLGQISKEGNSLRQVSVDRSIPK